MTRLLERRFGPLLSRVRDRIAAGDLDDLDGWLDRTLEADGLDAVFGTDNRRLIPGGRTVAGPGGQETCGAMPSGTDVFRMSVTFEEPVKVRGRLGIEAAVGLVSRD